MTFWAYMLHCRGGVYYVGHTDNLDYRIGQHQSGMIPGYTADKLPVTLVWSQDFSTRIEALEAERRIEGWSRAEKMALIRGDWDRISALAKGKNGPSTSSGRTEEGRRMTDSPVRPELIGKLPLVCHPDTPSKDVSQVHVAVQRIRGEEELWLEFKVVGAQSLLLPTLQKPERSNELWATTCFELFAKAAGKDRYLEFNFSPSTRWAAFEFDEYRSGIRELTMHDPEIYIFPLGDCFFLSVEAGPVLPRGDLKLALSAVIEETDGTKSYWALRHPPGDPDFHHPDCFTLTLEAPDPA